MRAGPEKAEWRSGPGLNPKLSSRRNGKYRTCRHQRLVGQGFPMKKGLVAPRRSPAGARTTASGVETLMTVPAKHCTPEKAPDPGWGRLHRESYWVTWMACSHRKRNQTRHEFEKVTGRATTRIQCEAGTRSHDLGHPGFLVGLVAANWFVGTMPSSSTWNPRWFKWCPGSTNMLPIKKVWWRMCTG